MNNNPPEVMCRFLQDHAAVLRGQVISLPESEARPLEARKIIQVIPPVEEVTTEDEKPSNKSMTRPKQTPVK